jgi:hypothetical protein
MSYARSKSFLLFRLLEPVKRTIKVWRADTEFRMKWCTKAAELKTAVKRAKSRKDENDDAVSEIDD